MGVSFKTSSRTPVRSVSLPCRSHPNTEELLNKANTWESALSSSSNPSAKMISTGFSHLVALYECLEDLFNTNLSHAMTWADELLDISGRLLDICSNVTEVMSHTKEQVRSFECDLRRNGGSGTERIAAKYVEFRNKLKKDIKRSMASLKQVDHKIRGCPFMVDSENYDLMYVVYVIREVTSFSTAVFRVMLEFLAIPGLRIRQTGRWKAISKLLSKSRVVPEAEDNADMNVNELQHLDAALLRYSSSKKHEFIRVVPINVEAVEATLEGLNSHLNVLSRRLVSTRVSILNKVSIY